MRASVLVVCIAAHAAHADTRIVVMADPADVSALQVALAGRGTEIATRPVPEGALRLDRAAAVQRTAMDAQAIAGVWIESAPGLTEVCVVSSDGKQFRHAPLPADLDETRSRVFAAIATSLLDEVVASPAEPPAPNVGVQVDVVPPAPVPAAEPPPRAANVSAPGLAITAPAPVVDRARDRVVEVGPMLSPATAGLEAEIALPIADHVRFGVMGGAGVTYVDPSVLYMGGAELTLVGHGSSHFNLGVIAGLSTATRGDGDGFAGVRFARVWQGPVHGLELSITPALYTGRSTYAPDNGQLVVSPGIWTSLRWEMPI